MYSSDAVSGHCLVELVAAQPAEKAPVRRMLASCHVELNFAEKLSLQRAHRRVQINRRNASHTFRRIQQSVARRSCPRSISRIQIIQGKSSHGIVMLPVSKFPLALFNSKQRSKFQE